jgi:predicted dehydrogenase
MPPAGLAIVGCGWAGARHAAALQAQGVEPLWAIDTDPQRIASVVSEGGTTRTGSDLSDALADAAVTAVDICLPHHLHVDACLQAIAAGKHVLCEKPLAPTLADADRLVAAAAQAGTLLMVAENEIFDQRYRAIHALLEDGAIGRPALVQATRECYTEQSFVAERPWWLLADEAGGGILLTGGVHDFAKLRLMLGEISMIYAVRPRQRFLQLETEDTVVMTLRFANGSAGTLVESFFMLDAITATGQEVHRLRIDGDDGSLEVTGADRLSLTNGHGTQEIVVDSEDTFQAELREFLACVESGREPVTSGRRQRRNLELVEAAYSSIKSGAPVEI